MVLKWNDYHANYIKLICLEMEWPTGRVHRVVAQLRIAISENCTDMHVNLQTRAS